MKEILLVMAVSGFAFPASACVSKMLHGDYIREFQKNEAEKLLWAAELRHMGVEYEDLQ